MIYTVTLNPSLDYLMELDAFKSGQLNRSNNENIFPGGKGINVSRILSQLDVGTTSLGFVGGFTGKYISDFLEKEQIITNFVEVDGTTRINVKIKAEDETEINANGPCITDHDLQLFLKRLDSLKAGDALVLAGSIPRSVSPDFYQSIANQIKDKDVRLIIDAEKKLLEPVLENRPFLIKPNHHELGEFFGVKIDSTESAIYYGKKLLEKGVQNLIVSMAAKGAILFHENQILLADVPDGELISSVGAGDSMVAGFLAGIQKGMPIKDAFKLAASAGSATAFSLGLANKVKIMELFEQVHINDIE
ncbi:1-phosphofructokinase [Falsibacillus albus]|uniref:Tagatose-6-phosphate kinase n=1 Tax=Falsibacillus albus TaxID=2478915 RepID=A0A3L7JXV9_9BACI|nr:1-phosphofructokinase [Falsibacillus albus]RLQ95360.1 1-phosphofructokinase [Falsibacillus albus]